MNLMLFCAGEGTRFRPQTNLLPKPALPFLTVPMVAYNVEWTRELPIRRIILNSYHLPKSIHELASSVREWQAKPLFSDEKSLLGGGGGLAQALPLMDSEEILCMNGDEIFLPDSKGQLTRAFKAHRDSKAIATLLVMKNPLVGTLFGGVWTDVESKVLGFGKTAWPSSTIGWHYIGAAFLSSGVRTYLKGSQPANLLYDNLTAAIADGHTVRVHEVSGFWRETGSLPHYIEATGDALALLTDRPSSPEALHLRQVLDRQSPGWTLGTERDRTWLQAAGAKVQAPASGFVVAGKGSTSSPTCRLSDVVLGANVHLPDGFSAEGKFLLKGLSLE